MGRPKKIINETKASTSLRIKSSSDDLWKLVSERLGISKVAVFEMLIRKEADRLGINVLDDHLINIEKVACLTEIKSYTGEVLFVGTIPPSYVDVAMKMLTVFANDYSVRELPENKESISDADNQLTGTRIEEILTRGSER